MLYQTLAHPLKDKNQLGCYDEFIINKKLEYIFITEPFFKNRLISMGNIWRTAIAIERKYNIEAWPIDKIVKSVDMYDSFGFNGFEVLDRFNEGYLMPCYGITRKEWRNKAWAIADRAHLNGQGIYLRALGNAVMDIPKDFKTDGPTSKHTTYI